MDDSMRPERDSLDPDSPVPAKKRKVGASGRGVASLTPEQLAKKRANDREAQRAIRERTKATIEGFERRIQELTTQQPYQELQAVIRQKDAIQAENEEIRRRLASIMSIIQPILGAQGLTDLATAASQNVQVDFSPQNTNVFQQDQYLNNGQVNRAYQSPNIASDASSSYTTPYGPSEQDQLSGNQVWSSSRDTINQQRESFHRNLELNETGERLSFNFLLDNGNGNGNGAGQQHVKQSLHQQQQQPQQHPPPPLTPSTQKSINTPTTTRSPFPLSHYPESAQPEHTILPKNCPSTCPLDSLLLNFLQERRREMAASSTVSPDTVAPAYPFVSSLLNPSSRTTIDPLSKLMTDIISKFPSISGLPEQVATLFMMFLFTRWQIYPTAENYERLPNWIKPRPSQRYTPHPAWMDVLPWPLMRDKVIENYQNYPFDDWFVPFTSGLSINWPYEPTDCLLSTDPRSGTTNQYHHNQLNGDGTRPNANNNTNTNPAHGTHGRDVEPVVTINPVFERHIRRLDNWSLGPQFAEAFPSLAHTATFRGRNTGGSGGVGVGVGVGGSAGGGAAEGRSRS